MFCFGNAEEIHSEAGLGAVGLALFVARLGGAEVKLHCQDGKGKGTFESLGASKGEVEFLGCSVAVPSGCVVTNPIIATFKGQLSSATMPATDLVIGAGAGEEFTKVTITTCSISGSYTVSGLQTVEFPKGEESLAEHEFVAKKAGSRLKIGAETGSFSGTAKVHLTLGAAYLIVLGT